MPYDPFQRPIQPGMQLPFSPYPQQALGPQAQQQPPVQQAQQDILKDPDALKALLATYGDQLEMSDYEKQMSRVQALRDQLPDAEGRQAGRVYVAANPLEHVGKAIGQYNTMKKEKGFQSEIDKRKKSIGEKVATYGTKILGEE